MSKPTPSFPGEVWDGTTENRPDYEHDYQWPTPQDFDRVVEEVRAVQTHALAGRDEDGVVTLAPSVTKGTDPVATNVNDAFTINTKDIVLAIGGSAVASVDLGYNIPANSLILGVASNIETTITLATAVKIGIGVSGDLDKYGIITGGTANSKSTRAITPTELASAEDIKVYACDTNGDAAGTIQNGSIRVRITFMTQAALPDA